MLRKKLGKILCLRSHADGLYDLKAQIQPQVNADRGSVNQNKGYELVFWHAEPSNDGLDADGDRNFAEEF